MRFLRFFSCFLLILFFTSSAYSAENAFYILRGSSKHTDELKATLAKIKNNRKSIHLLISQAYRINKNGEVLGSLNPEVVAFAHQYSIKLMALVTNVGYEPKVAHQFLVDVALRDKAIQAILLECKKNNLYGVQFDFEGIDISDKAALTAFYQQAADVLHQNGFKVSFAVIPAFKKEMSDSIFLRKTYDHWAGVYDLKTLAKAADFITLMAYNQHPDGTIPGPTASIGFTEAAIKQALKEIPAKKLSLGIPAYSLYWYNGYSTIALRNAEISFKDADTLIKKHHAELLWNKKEKVNYSVYENNWLNEYVYLEDVKSFQAKLTLTKKYKLRGISVFRIGTEDNRIWALLTKNKRIV